MNDSLTLTPVVQVVGGLVILFLGRRLFWLFVGMTGFFFGLQLGIKLFAGMGDVVILLLSLLAGLVCAGFAVLFQRLAVIIAGGLIGGMLAVQIAPAVGMHSDSVLWGIFLAGVVLAAVMVNVSFNPMLILLSSVAGAMMIADALQLDPLLEPILIAICFVLGLVVQTRSYLRSHRAAV